MKDYQCMSCNEENSTGLAGKSARLCPRCMAKAVDALPDFGHLTTDNVKLILNYVGVVIPVNRSGMSLADWHERIRRLDFDALGRLCRSIRKLTLWAGWRDYSDDRDEAEQIN